MEKPVRYSGLKTDRRDIKNRNYTERRPDV